MLFFKGNIYGTCCGHQCGGYEGGKSAILHAADGLFDGAPYKEWKRGSEPLVYWKMGAEHRGGYAYRLCKVVKTMMKSTSIFDTLHLGHL